MQRRTKATWPGGRKISVHEEPLSPGVFLLSIQGRNIGAVDLNDGIIEYDPSKTSPEIVRSFALEYFGLVDEDIVGTEVVRY